MSLSPNRHDELVRLLGRVRDESITEPELSRLETVLTEDAEARELYLQFMTLHAALEQVGTPDLPAERLRETLHDDEVVRELQAMITADERTAFASRSRSGAAGRYLAVAATVAALILAALFLGQLIRRRQSEAACFAEIAAVYGQVESSGAGDGIRVMQGAVIEPGQSVSTGPNAGVRLQYPDGSTVDLKAATELTLLKGEQAKRLRLLNGSAYFAIQPQPARAPLVVNPGRYDQVKVLGTNFQVSRDNRGETRVRVVSGAVRFGADVAAVPIKARQESFIRPRQKPSKPKTFDKAAVWQGLSRGLTAAYYDREDLTGESVMRVDPLVDFDWKKSPPDPALPPDGFSARWTGQVEAEHTEPYKFYVLADEGAKLWIDGKLVIDGWKNSRGVKLTSPPMKLVAGRRYELKLEYYDAKDAARIQLLWSSPSTPRTIVPHSQLHPNH
jgi:hypothetical protein